MYGTPTILSLSPLVTLLETALATHFVSELTPSNLRLITDAHSVHSTGKCVTALIGTGQSNGNSSTHNSYRLGTVRVVATVRANNAINAARHVTSNNRIE